MNSQENRRAFVCRLERSFSENDRESIMFAYDLSKYAHRGHFREVGPRYFEHPREMCLIVLDELKVVDRDALIAIFIHDVGEDVGLFGNIKELPYEKFEAVYKGRVSKIFGEDIAQRGLALIKPEVDNLRFLSKEEAMEFYIARLLKDRKACWLKMVDVLHNLRSSVQFSLSRKKWAIRKYCGKYRDILEEGRKYDSGEKLYELINVAAKSLQEE